MPRRALDRRSLLRLGLAGAAVGLRAHLAVRQARAQEGRGAPLPDPRERHLAGLRQLTFGGQNAEAYWDRSGTRLVFQSTRPPFGCDQTQQLVRPNRAELFIMDADRTGARQVTRNGAANWAPSLHPDGERIVFSSNLQDPGRFDFALYLVRRDGHGFERLTYGEILRFLPDVLPGRPPPGLLLEPRRRCSPRVQRVRRRLGRVETRARGRPAAVHPGTGRVRPRRMLESGRLERYAR